MSDISNQMLSALLDSNKALIASNESISASVRANSETVKATNETVKELTVNVRELVTTERERVLKDEYQQEINVKQGAYNVANDARWEDAHDTIVRAKRFHKVFDSVSVKVTAMVFVAVLALLGFKFS